MQHAGLQYGQGAVNSHQSPPFAHTDISQTNGGNTTSSLRQFRKKDGSDKNSNADLNTSVDSSHIARVPPHNHYPARPNDYFRYQHQYPDYNSPYKETPAQVKYSEIAETPPQPIQHVDHLPAALQKHKEVHKDFMDMCNISQQTHMKQNYPDNLTRQQSYPPDAASVHHQYLHKEPQVHPGYKPESQYQQYPQIPKYNMPSQCRKYPPAPPPENDFLAKLQRINPSMARSIMSDHHIRESQATYPTVDQNRMYQNQRYYPTHIQNNLSYPNYQPYSYPSSCNYKHPEYPRSNQMGVGGTQYPAPSLSPRNLHMMNYGTSPQKISPNYSQYNPPEYAQHYQHRRASIPQDYYQQTCRTNPYMSGHQISSEPTDNRGSGGGLRHFIENWAEEEGSAEITPIFKENIRIHNNDANNEQVFVINSSDIPQCLENVSLVPTENGQYIIKTGALDNSVVRIKETTETNGERTVNLQIVEAPAKPDCMLAEENAKTTVEETPVPYQDNQQSEKDCDDITKTQTVQEEEEAPEEKEKDEDKSEDKSEESSETSVIVSNEVSVIKDMPLIDEEHKNEETEDRNVQAAEKPNEDEDNDNVEESHEDKSEEEFVSTTRRTQRIFSVDDIINNIGSSPTETRRNSLQFIPQGIEEKKESTSNDKDESEDVEDGEYRSAISVEDDSVILEIGGAWVQLNINHLNGTKVLSVLPLSDSLVIDVNGNNLESEEVEDLQTEVVLSEDPPSDFALEDLEEISSSVFQSEVIIGDESLDNDVFLDLSIDALVGEEQKKEEVAETTKKRDGKRKSKDNEDKRKSNKKIRSEERKSEERPKMKKDVLKTSTSEEGRRKDATPKRKEDNVKAKKEKKLTPQNSVEDEYGKKKDVQEEISKAKKSERRSLNSVEEEDTKKEEHLKLKKSERRSQNDVEDEDIKKEEVSKLKKTERRPTLQEENPVEEIPIVKKDEEAKLKKEKDGEKLKKGKRVEEEPPKQQENETLKILEEGFSKHEYTEKMKTTIEELPKQEESTKQEAPPKQKEPSTLPLSPFPPLPQTPENPTETEPTLIPPLPPEEKERAKPEPPEPMLDSPKPPEPLSEYAPSPVSDVVKIAEEMIAQKQLEESKEGDKLPTKAAKKLYDSPLPIKEAKKTLSKLEETVNKIKSLKEKKTSLKDTEKKTAKVVKKVTFKLETEIREITKDEIDKKKLSWEEYNSRKRKEETKIMENTVTSTDDIADQVELSVENVVKETPPKATPTNWEEDTPSPESPRTKHEAMSTTNRKCIIDVNEFNIKPIESISTPSPVSSSQFSYHSEDDSLQVYKDVVDSKLNSLNIKIPKLSKPKRMDRFSILLDRFLNKGTLNYEELEEVKKFIEIKRKMMEEEKKLTYEVKNERDYKDLKLHFRKVPEKRKKKRFRNLYTDTSEDSDSSRSEKVVADYSVYQRDSQGVPKLIFKRKSGLPQPFVKLERSQAAELLVKKRKLY